MKEYIKMVVGILFYLVATHANAAIVTLDVIDAVTIEISLSGVIKGPEPDYSSGTLFIDVPDVFLPMERVFPINITGNAMIGSLSFYSVFSGFRSGLVSDPLEGLQIRGSQNGETPFNIGDVLSGSSIIIFSNPHQLTSEMFSGNGTAVYWGISTSVQDELLQGYAITSIPIPSALILFNSVILVLFTKKMHNKFRHNRGCATGRALRARLC